MGSPHAPGASHLVRPHLEPRQRIGSEGGGDWHIRGVAPAGDQNAADARLIVARIEGAPRAAEPDLEPGGAVALKRHLFAWDNNNI
jgi:hypothetical protein